MSAPSADPAHFEEAVRAWRERVPVTEAEYSSLSQEARRRAFTVAGATQLELVADVWRALDAALARGEAFDAFKARVAEGMGLAWAGEKPWRLETVFRTNVQQAYSAGRQRIQASAGLRRRRPFLKYSAVLDGRTSGLCRPLAGTVLRADDPFWSTHQPPLHFGCRSTLISLTADAAAEAGVTDDPPEVDAQEGFGREDAGADWEPDLSNVPAPLAQAFRRKQERR